MDGVRRARTRGPRAGPSRGRGVRTRGGRGASNVEVEVVVVNVGADQRQGRVRGRGRSRGQGRGARRPRAVDELNIVPVEDWLHGGPMETPLNKKRRRNWPPPSSSETPSPAIPSTSSGQLQQQLPIIYELPQPSAIPSTTSGQLQQQLPIIYELPQPSAIPSTTSGQPQQPLLNPNLDIWAPSPAMFIECREDGSVPIPPPQRRQERALRDDEIEFLLHYGSEPELESDGEEVETRVFVPRVERFVMDTPQDEGDAADPVPVIDIDSSSSRHSSTHQGGASGPTFGPDFYDFEWRAFPNPPLTPELRRETFSNTNVGPTTPCVDPYEIFTSIWDRQFMEHIVAETNRYAKELLELQSANNTLHPKSRIREWRDTTTDELYTYLAIVLAMGSVVKPRMEAYWSPIPNIFYTPMFRSHMTLRRFQLLSRCLHFNHNESISDRNVGVSEAKIFKIKPVIDHLNKKFQEMYTMQQNLALDESLLLWKGWLSINQHIPNKAASIGVKTYELCESQTGYLWRFEIHAHSPYRQTDPSDPLDAFTPAVVLRLLDGLQNKGHTIWMDNFYNSPALARKLKTMGFDCVGTLRTNRTFVPEALHKLTKDAMRPGTIAGFTSGDVDVMVWRDKNRVALISTYHGNGVTTRDGSTKPNLVFDYNVMMGGVDKKDQMLALYPVERKRTKIWYKKFFRRLLNISVLNAYIICRRSSSRMEHSTFRESLILSLLDKHSTGTMEPTPDSRSVDYHYLAELPMVGRQRLRRACKICKKKVQTYCVGCDKTVCMNICFSALHKR